MTSIAQNQEFEQREISATLQRFYSDVTVHGTGEQKNDKLKSKSISLETSWISKQRSLQGES